MIFQSLFGLFALAVIAWALSENRRDIRWQTIGAGVTLQFIVAISLLRAPVLREIFFTLNRVMEALTTALEAGTSFVFGYAGGGATPFVLESPEHSYIFAFRALPFILLISALSSMLFYLRILPLIVRGMSYVLTRTMRVGGAVGLGVAGNVFLGMAEAPLMVAPYVSRMTRSEVFVLMTAGMATVAGTVMVLYANILNGIIPDPLAHVLTASLINAPGAIVVATIMVPPAKEKTEGEMVAPQEAHSVMDAVAQGTQQGIKILLSVTAMLIVLVALVSLANQALGLLPAITGSPLTLQRLLGYLLAPIAWLMGVPWSEAMTAGGLLGTKVILNEFIAYVDLANLPAGALSARSRLIMSYALCGFANFGSLGIILGAFSNIAPDRRAEIATLGLKSIAAGLLATCMTGAIIGIVAA